MYSKPATYMELILTHPILGQWDSRTMTHYHTFEKITNDWKKRYGQKFYEMDVSYKESPIATISKIQRPPTEYSNPPFSYE